MDATARSALYDEIGTHYAQVRRADARIAARIHHALGDARSVIEALAAVFQSVEVETVPLAHDCTDGFFGAYWRRPWAYLDPQVQAGISLLRQLEARTVEKALSKLKDDLESGAWEELIGRHLPNDALDLGYRIVVADLG